MRKKFLYLVLVLFYCCENASAQLVVNINSFRKESWDMPHVNEEYMLKYISEIEVVDARPDTSFLGFQKINSLRKITQKPLVQYEAVVFNKSLENEFRQAYSNKEGNSISGFQILIAVKEFWMFDNVTDDALVVKESVKNSSGFLYRADIYLKRNQDYIPLFQMDTIFNLNKSLKFAKAKLLEGLFLSLSEKISNKKLSEVFNNAKRVKSRLQVDSFYRDMNLLKKPAFFKTDKQYIFKTFKDFKNGFYTEERFKVTSDYLGDYLYKIEANGTENLSKDYALILDGQIFINTNNTYSVVLYNNNRVYTIGSKLTVGKTNKVPTWLFNPFVSDALSILNGGIEVADNSKRSYQPMMLDMVTGNIY